jgi:hypothetical protein
MEDFSSDHAVILQRVYNFLSSVLGSDPSGSTLSSPTATSQ